MSKFNYSCSNIHDNVYKLQSKSTKVKAYIFQKKINGKLYYKRFHLQREAINFSNIINKSLKLGVDKTIKKYLK